MEHSMRQRLYNRGHEPSRGHTGGLGGGQMSGNRAYVTRDTKKECSLKEENCQIIQSLAAGGLGAAWGAAVVSEE
jgi:hypothetical protein